MMHAVPLILLALAARPAQDAGAAGSFRIELQGHPLNGAPLPGVTITALTASGQPDGSYSGQPATDGLRFLIDEREVQPRFENGRLAWETNSALGTKLYVTAAEIRVRAPGREGTVVVRRIPGWLSLLPPVVAVAAAILLRRVFVALMLGVFSGALVLTLGNPLAALLQTAGNLLGQFIALDTVAAVLASDHPMREAMDLNLALLDLDHTQLILFTIFIGAMVGVMSRSGGTHGIVGAVSTFAHTHRRGQFVGWLLGLLIFFDDYANSLLVGSTMRPLSDRLRISREKLAYIVDSTAAPVAGIALISTWVGTEIGYIQDAYAKLGLGDDVYYTFLATIPYRFYALLTLVFVLLVALLGRDFGPMLAAERRAHHLLQPYRPGAQIPPAAKLDHLNPAPDAPRRWINALLPIGAVILLVMLGLYYMGTRALVAGGAAPEEFTLRRIIGSADSYPVLLFASLAGSLLAAALAWSQGILTLGGCARAWRDGAAAMLLAVGILVLAWSLSAVCDEANLNTAWFVVEQTEDYLSPRWLPTLGFLLSAAIAFATGTSWGTMGILTPLMIFVTHRLLSAQAAVDPNDPVMLATIGAVLAGSIFGDHCSPISDTTVLSSMASGCDHLDHVATQIPYALAVALVAILLGYLPAGVFAGSFLGNPWLLLAIGSLSLIALLALLGRSPSAPDPSTPAAPTE